MKVTLPGIHTIGEHKENVLVGRPIATQIDRIDERPAICARKNKVPFVRIAANRPNFRRRVVQHKIGLAVDTLKNRFHFFFLFHIQNTPGITLRSDHEA